MDASIWQDRDVTIVLVVVLGAVVSPSRAVA